VRGVGWWWGGVLGGGGGGVAFMKSCGGKSKF